MEQSSSQPASAIGSSEQDRAVASLAASIEQLDELGLYDDLGRVVVEPAHTFRAS